MLVMKFGGSSVADIEQMENVVGIISDHLKQNPIVVVSAHEGVTDMLENNARRAAEGEKPDDRVRRFHMDLADRIGDEELIEDVQSFLDDLDVLLNGISMVRELTPRTLDYVRSFGERLSARVLATILRQHGVSARARDAFDVGMITNSNFGSASPLPMATNRIREHLSDPPNLPVVTGYIGKNRHGDITTLGRNGSDYTATFMGAALGAEHVQLWSDVSGMMTADPELISSAQPIETMTFSEASELAYYGGHIHPSTLVPAVKQSIPIHMRNSFHPDEEGTIIVENVDRNRAVTSIVYKEDIFLIDISTPNMLARPGFMEDIFQVFGQYNVVIDMISTSEVSVSCTTDSRKNLDAVKKKLESFSEVNILPERSIVCIVGIGMKRDQSVNERIFSSLRKQNISAQMVTQGERRINLSLIVDNEEVTPSIETLHAEFFGEGA